MANQLWLMKRIREEEELTLIVDKSPLKRLITMIKSFCHCVIIIFYLLQTFFSVFLDDCNSFSFLSFADTTPHEFIITGNIHLDKHSDHATSQFLSLLSSFNLTQHVNFPSHNQNHIIDLVITSSDSLLVPSLLPTALHLTNLISLL